MISPSLLSILLLTQFSGEKTLQGPRNRLEAVFERFKGVRRRWGGFDPLVSAFRRTHDSVRLFDVCGPERTVGLHPLRRKLGAPCQGTQGKALAMVASPARYGLRKASVNSSGPPR